MLTFSCCYFYKIINLKCLVYLHIDVFYTLFFLIKYTIIAYIYIIRITNVSEYKIRRYFICFYIFI